MKLYNNIDLLSTPTEKQHIINKKVLDDEVSKINAKLNLSLEKTIVCIVDDDGTNRTSDAYTGMTTWLNDKGIPMNFAICHDTIGTSGKYTVTQLQELQAKGNDILIHGNPKLTTLADETAVITEIESALQFHTSNGLKPTNVYVYPQGLNSDGTLTAKQVKEIVGRYFDYGLNVNIASMSGEDTKGLWNKVPLVDKLNIARMEVSSTKGLDANKSKIDACIENKGLLILFTHSFQSQFTSGGYDEFKKIINYLSTQDVEFLTVSNALKKIENIKDGNKFALKEDIVLINENAKSGQIADAKSVYGKLYKTVTETIIDVAEHYELASVQDGSEGLKIVADGTVADIDKEIQLSDVQAKLLNTDVHVYAAGEYVVLIPEQNHEEEYEESIYLPRSETPESATFMTIKEFDDMWGTTEILPYTEV